jgi:hypothetical protein
MPYVQEEEEVSKGREAWREAELRRAEVDRIVTGNFTEAPLDWIAITDRDPIISNIRPQNLYITPYFVS